MKILYHICDRINNTKSQVFASRPSKQTGMLNV